MATESILYQHDPAATIYASIFNVAGEVFDFNDNTFKALGGATTPYLALTEYTAPGGSAFSFYAASFDLADINNTATRAQYAISIYEQAGGSPAPSTDTVLSNPSPFSVRFGATGDWEVRHQIDGCFTTTAGTTVRFLVKTSYGDQRIALETVDPTATAALAVREYGAGADLFTISATTVNAAGIFELEKANPGYTADRLYKYTLTIVINGVTFTFVDFLPNQG